METIRRIREMCDTLVPAVLEDLGLAAAIDWVVADFRLRNGVVCDIRVTQDELRISREAQCLLLRILQETLLHAAPAQASSRFMVELTQHKRAVVLRVNHEGHPQLEPGSRMSGQMDLGDLRARVAIWGGRVRVWYTPGRVAYLEVRLPVVDAATAG